MKGNDNGQAATDVAQADVYTLNLKGNDNQPMPPGKFFHDVYTLNLKGNDNPYTYLQLYKTDVYTLNLKRKNLIRMILLISCVRLLKWKKKGSPLLTRHDLEPFFKEMDLLGKACREDKITFKEYIKRNKEIMQKIEDGFTKH